MPLRLLVTVSRGYPWPGMMNEALADVFWEWGAPRDAVLVSGHCPDGDQDAEKIWTGHGLTVEPHPARWHQHADNCPAWHAGQSICLKAGFRRDAEMVAAGADRCLAFIGFCVDGKCRRPKPHPSHGATGTARMARAAGIDTRPVTDATVRRMIPDLFRPVLADETLPLPGT